MGGPSELVSRTHSGYLGSTVCVQITSNPYGDATAIALGQGVCLESTLARVSDIRPGKLFTTHDSLFLRVVARMRSDKLAYVRQAVIALIQIGRLPVTEP